MIIWDDDLYVGESAAQDYEKIIEDMEKGVYRSDTWLIALGSNAADQLELFSAVSLYMPALKRRLQKVIGIASGKEEAMSLFVTIAGDVYRKTGGCAIRDWFENKKNG